MPVRGGGTHPFVGDLLRRVRQSCIFGQVISKGITLRTFPFAVASILLICSHAVAQVSAEEAQQSLDRQQLASLKAENEKLRAENERLASEVEKLRAMVPDDAPAEPSGEATASEDADDAREVNAYGVRSDDAPWVRKLVNGSAAQRRVDVAKCEECIKTTAEHLAASYSARSPNLKRPIPGGGKSKSALFLNMNGPDSMLTTKGEIFEDDRGRLFLYVVRMDFKAKIIKALRVQERELKEKHRILSEPNTPLIAPVLNMRVGSIGALEETRASILQRVDASTALLKCNGRTVFAQGFDFSKNADNEIVNLGSTIIVEVTGTKTYVSVNGETNTVLVIKNRGEIPRHVNVKMPKKLDWFGLPDMPRE